MKVSFGLGIPKHDEEGRVITLEFEKVFLTIFPDKLMKSFFIYGNYSLILLSIIIVKNCSTLLE
jgi:hypothetical protein